ncbi:hypothetical protein D3C71_1678260 [compost metagenome]
MTLPINSFFAFAVLPSLLEPKSKSSNRLLKSSAESVPSVLCSILRSVAARSSRIKPVPAPLGSLAMRSAMVWNKSVGGRK